MSETLPNGMNKPYDSAFKSIIQKCPRLALFLINEMFFRNGLIQKEYDGTERVTLLNRELTDLEFGNLAEDLRLKVGMDDREVFHMECESTAGDTRVMLRMVRYDTGTALDDMTVEDHCIRVRIDDSGVLFLRSTGNTPSMVTVILEGPQGSSMSYQIPTLKLQDYSMEMMLERKLYILLPFLFFNYEKQLGKASDPAVYQEIDKLFGTIVQRLKELTEQGTLTVYESSTLYDALKVVVEALGKKNRAEKEVQSIMGGQILEFSADKYYNAGVEKGLEQGREEGREQGIEKGTEDEKLANLKTIMRKMKCSAEKAVDFLDVAIEDQPRYVSLLKEEGASFTSYLADQ